MDDDLTPIERQFRDDHGEFYRMLRAFPDFQPPWRFWAQCQQFAIIDLSAFVISTRKALEASPQPITTDRVLAILEDDAREFAALKQAEPDRTPSSAGTRSARKRHKTVVVAPGYVVAIESPQAQAYLADCAAKGIAPNYG